MSEPYTPSIKELIDFWAIASPNRGMSVPERTEAASRAVAEHDRQVAELAFDAGFEKATDLTTEDFWSDAWSDDHNPHRRKEQS